MGIIATLMSLAGCGQSSSYDPWAGDRKVANPPPKPPSCPHLSELANVTRSDGSIIDVRIIQIDDIKLYVPRNWLDRDLEFGHKFASKHPTTGSILGVYEPDLNNMECPGVVHRFVSKRRMFDLYFDFVVRRGNADSWILPNFTLRTKVDQLSIRRLRGVGDPKYRTEHMWDEGIIDWPTDTSTSAYVVLFPKHLVGVYRWPKSKPVGSTEWAKARTDVIDLVGWLRIPPNKRDNGRIFNLGAE